MKTILWPVFRFLFKITFRCHLLKPKLARYGCLAKNYRIRVFSSFAHIWWKNSNSCLWFSLTIFHRWSLQISNNYQQIEKCCPVLMFSIIYFYDFCGRQNHCPNSKNYNLGNTGTERLWSRLPFESNVHKLPRAKREARKESQVHQCLKRSESL